MQRALDAHRPHPCEDFGLSAGGQLTHATIDAISLMLIAVDHPTGAGPVTATGNRDTEGYGKQVALTLKRAVATFCAATAAAILCVSAWAQTTTTSDEARKRLEADKRNLDAKQKRSKELQTDLDKIAAERQRINARLLETGKLIHSSEAQLSLIESRLGELQSQERHLRGMLEQRHETIAALLAAMQRMGRNPPPVMITQRDDALAMVRSAMLLASAFPNLREQATSLADQLKDLARVMGSIRTEGDKLKAETERLAEARTRLAALQESKRQSLTERQAELSSVRDAASKISKSVEDLSDLISRLDKEVGERTGLGVYAEKEAKTPPGSGDAVAVLAPSGRAVTSQSPGRIEPGVPFAQAKGQLQIPAQGRRVLTYGEKTQYGSLSKGLGVQTRYSGRVLSPCDGWVVYAGEFRAYGQLLIINGGGGYHILLAGLSQIDVQAGQFVLMGEPVGVMSAAIQTTQASVQDGGPVLYIELRKDGRPIDPDPWWSEASRKVQG
jgi:septal ring factor EnvC (AmiA/AmiB activator)